MDANKNHNFEHLGLPQRLSIDVAAKALGRDVKDIKRFVRNGLIGHYADPDGTLWFAPEDLVQFINQTRREATWLAIVPPTEHPTSTSVQKAPAGKSSGTTPSAAKYGTNPQGRWSSNKLRLPSQTSSQDQAPHPRPIRHRKKAA